MLDGALRDLLRERPFTTTAEAQRFLDAKVRAYNTRPQRELGGLSPIQMSELLAGDWATSGAMRINSVLEPNELREADFLFNARVFLAALRDEGPAKATTAGNLTRAFVAQMLDRMRWRPEYLKKLRRMNKVINEFDVPPLGVMRDVLTLAGLIRRQKGFRITPAARWFLEEARQVELYLLLFRTLLVQLDFRVLSPRDSAIELQQTIAFTFWKLRSEATDWATPLHLAKVAWLETAREPLVEMTPLDDIALEWTFRHCVVEPLRGFGLLETRDIPSKKLFAYAIEVRKTPLYDRVLTFSFST